MVEYKYASRTYVLLQLELPESHVSIQLASIMIISIPLALILQARSSQRISTKSQGPRSRNQHHHPAKCAHVTMACASFHSGSLCHTNGASTPTPIHLTYREIVICHIVGLE
jgi:hypothetical protein